MDQTEFRSREEILKNAKEPAVSLWMQLNRLDAILEVMLDIRDVLKELKNK